MMQGILQLNYHPECVPGCKPQHSLTSCMAMGRLHQLFLVSVALSHTVAKELTLPALTEPKARTASHVAKRGHLVAWSLVVSALGD